MGQLRKNGIIYSGGILNVLGAFIDTDNEIASGTYSASSPLSYTATEDCFAYVHVILDVRNAEVKIYIDGVQVYVGFSNNTAFETVQDAFTCYLKKGQVLTATTTRADNASIYKIYGIQTGTQELPEYHKYSTDERIVGEWNGKTVYEKTVVSTSNLNYGQINNISTGISGADEVLLMTGSVSYGSNNSYLPLPYGEASSNEIIKVGEFNKTSGNVQIFVGSAYQSPYLINKVILTIRYTKS